MSRTNKEPIEIIDFGSDGSGSPEEVTVGLRTIPTLKWESGGVSAGTAAGGMVIVVAVMRIISIIIIMIVTAVVLETS